MWQDQLLILLFLLVIYRTTGHLYQRARWNGPDCSYRWFYVIVNTCRFCTWKSFNKYFTICIQFFGHFPSIKVSYHTVSYDKYRFFVLFPFWFVIFVITCCNYFLWVTTTIQWSYDCHVLVDLFRCIFLLFILLDFCFFIAETTWSVFILALLAVDVFLCFVVVCN